MIQTRGLCKTFAGLTAVNGVDLQVTPGEIFGLVGPDGAGKTTLMKILFGIEQLTSGEIKLNGKNVKISSPLHAID